MKTEIVIALLFILFGILIKYGKMYFLIAGYNTMSKGKKQNYNIEGIATLFRNVMFGMALLIFIGYFFSWLVEVPAIQMVTFIAALVIGVPYLVIESNSKKFKKNKR